MSTQVIFKGGGKDEEILQDTSDTGITDRYSCHSEMVENITNYTFLV